MMQLNWMKPNFISSKIFNENLVAVHNIKQKLYMDQPIYLRWVLNPLQDGIFHYVPK